VAIEPKVIPGTHDLLMDTSRQLVKDIFHPSKAQVSPCLANGALYPVSRSNTDSGTYQECAAAVDMDPPVTLQQLVQDSFHPSKAQATSPWEANSALSCLQAVFRCSTGSGLFPLLAIAGAAVILQWLIFVSLFL
jgi:hypothetical protein